MAHQKNNDLEFTWSKKGFQALSSDAQLTYCYLVAATGHTIGTLPGLISQLLFLESYEISLSGNEPDCALDDLRIAGFITLECGAIYVPGVIGRPQSKPTRVKHLTDWKVALDKCHPSLSKIAWLNELSHAMCDWPSKFHIEAARIFFDEKPNDTVIKLFDSKESLLEAKDIVALFATEFQVTFGYPYVPDWVSDARHIKLLFNSGLTANDLTARIPSYFKYLKQHGATNCSVFGFSRNINKIKPSGPVQTTEQSDEYQEILAGYRARLSRKAGVA